MTRIGRTGIRRTWATVTAVALLATPLAMTAPSSATPRVTPAAAARTYTLPELVSSLPTAPPMLVGYKGAEQFIPKTTASRRDTRGCDLRQRTIIALAKTKPRIGKRCAMTGGTWVIDNGTRTVRSVKGLRLLPTMPNKMAWGQGAYAWTPAQRLAWATNTGPSLQGRAGGVVTQATQTLVSPDFLRIVERAVYNDEEQLSRLVNDFGLPCFNATKSMDCLSLALWVYSFTANQTTSACTGLAQRAANLSAWGLALASASAYSAAEAVDVCRRGALLAIGQPITVVQQTAIYGIAPINSPSATPATFVPASQPLFSGYAAPVTDPATRLFGTLAPVDWGDPQVPVDSLRLWDAGVSWRQVEVSRGAYDWRTLDKTIDMARRIGAQVQYVLGDTPAWANGGAAGNVPPANLDHAGDFIRAVCQRYQGSIALYEAWNEGNIVEFWNGTPQQLADLTGVVHGAVQSCFPSATVIASSAGARATGGLATRYMPYLQALRTMANANGGQWPMDAVEVHSYPAATGTPIDRVAIIKQWSAMLDANGVPSSMPRFDGELNYGLAGLGQARVPIDRPTGAAWLAQSYIQSMQYGITTLHWFLWTGARGDYDKLGIQFNDGTALVKQAWTTTRDWLYGARMQRCAQRDNLLACQLTARDGTNMTVAYSVDGAATSIDPTGLGTSVCYLGGQCEAVAGRTSIAVGASPIALVNR